MKINLFYSAPSLALVILIFASCSKEYHPQFAGRYHPKVQNMRTAAEPVKLVKQKEEITPLPTLPEKPVLASADNQAEIISEQKRPVEYSPQYHPLIRAKATDRINPPINENQPVTASTETTSPNVAATEHKIHHSFFRSMLAHGDQLLSVVVAIFLPFVGVAIYENAITIHFWIALLLWLFFWLPGFIYALIIILGT
jgi:uncharacterized membrane protein YqaE (UPF0057 family)